MDTRTEPNKSQAPPTPTPDPLPSEIGSVPVGAVVESEQKPPSAATATNSPESTKAKIVQLKQKLQEKKLLKKVAIGLFAVILLFVVVSKLIPNNKKAESSSTPASVTAPRPSDSAPARQCLSDADYIDLSGSTTTAYTKENPWTDTIYFQPNATSFENEKSAREAIQKLQLFYDRNAVKQFIILLLGGVSDTQNTANGIGLSNDRVEKVRTLLTDKEIPASRISSKILDQKDSATLGQVDRIVQITIDPTCLR